MTVWHTLITLWHLSISDYIAVLPGFLALLCIAPSAINTLKGQKQSVSKDVIPGAKIGPFTVFDYMTGNLIMISIVLTFNYIYSFLSGGSTSEKLVNGSILVSTLVGISIHFLRPRDIIHPFIPTPIIWGVASLSAYCNYHVDPTISFLYTLATGLLCLSETLSTGETTKVKPTKRLGRRASFLTAQMAQGAFPKKSQIPPPVIQGITRFESLPPEAEFADYLNSLLRRKSQYKRLTSIAITDPNGDLYWEEVLEFDVRNHTVKLQVKNEEELMAYVKSIIFNSLPFDKPLWQLHMIENEGGNDAIIFSIHHALGDGISIFNLAADVFTDAEGKPLPTTPFLRRPNATNIGNIFRTLVEYAFITLLSFLKVIFLPIMPGDTSTVIKDPFKPYKFQPDRQIVTIEKISLADVKKIKNKFGVTINDVLTSVLAGAFDRYLKDQAGPDATKDVQIRTLMPVAFPRKPTEIFRNLWCFISVLLPISSTIQSPSERLLAANKTLARLKHSPEAFIQITIQELINKLFDLDSAGQLALNVMTKHTCVFTNVIGPTTQVYCLGKPVLELQPIIANIINQISTISYNNTILMNLVVDPNVVKHAEKLADFFLAELDDLRKAAASM